MRSHDPKQFLSEEEKKLVADSIQEAEKMTSAEIKLVIARHCWGKIHDKAAGIFKKRHLDQTTRRNCVLILLIVTNREFLIYGDRGIHEKMGQQLWDNARNAMADDFKAGNFGKGLCSGIALVGQRLSEGFPHIEGDINEIPDEVAYED